MKDEGQDRLMDGDPSSAARSILGDYADGGQRHDADGRSGGAIDMGSYLRLFGKAGKTLCPIQTLEEIRHSRPSLENLPKQTSI